MVATFYQGVLLCSLLWTFTKGENCFNCIYAYDWDLSSIESAYSRMALKSLVLGYSTTPECRTPGANDVSLVKSCPSVTQSKIPACVVFEGTMTFLSIFSPENFTMSIVYRGCAEVDSNFVTSCYQSEGTDWTALQINTDMPNFQEACTAGYFTGTICHNVSAVDSKGKSVHRIDCYCFIVQLFVSVVLITLML
uniref:Uncharacterized protein LOC111124065 n=1 Tax=Crassostrea virginica TaxID=6565 RepID=A0A8B8D526_CRAVI|nr:uncharacterized protein LOC111124065 [Crassostrea virginica]